MLAARFKFGGDLYRFKPSKLCSLSSKLYCELSRVRFETTSVNLDAKDGFRAGGIDPRIHVGAAFLETASTEKQTLNSSDAEEAFHRAGSRENQAVIPEIFLKSVAATQLFAHLGSRPRVVERGGPSLHAAQGCDQRL